MDAQSALLRQKCDMTSSEIAILNSSLHQQQTKLHALKIRGNATPLQKLTAAISQTENALDILQNRLVNETTAWQQLEMLAQMARPVSGNLNPIVALPILKSQTLPEKVVEDEFMTILEPAHGHQSEYVCPYTLTPFTRPFANKNCSHHLDEQSVRQLLVRAARPRQLKVAKVGERPLPPPEHFNCPVYGCTRHWGPDTFSFDSQFLGKVKSFFAKNALHTEDTRIGTEETDVSTKLGASIMNVRRQNSVIDLIDSDCECSNAGRDFDQPDSATVRLAPGSNHQNCQCEVLPAAEASLPADAGAKRRRQAMQTTSTSSTRIDQGRTFSMLDPSSVPSIPETHDSSSILAQLLQQECPPSGVLCPAEQHQMTLCSSGASLSHGLASTKDCIGYTIKCGMEYCQQCWYVPMTSAGSNLGNIHKNAVNWEAARAESRSLQEGELHTLFYYCFACAEGFYSCLDCCAAKFPHLGTKPTLETYLQELQSGQGRIDLESVVRKRKTTTKTSGNESQDWLEEFVDICEEEESELLARARLLRLAVNLVKQKNSMR